MSEYTLHSLTDPNEAPQVSKPSSSPTGGMGLLPPAIAARLPGKPPTSEPTVKPLPIPGIIPLVPTTQTTAPRTPSIGVTSTTRLPSFPTPTRPSLTGTRVPPSSTTSPKDPSMSSCSCEVNGLLSIPAVIDTIGARQPTSLAKNVVLPAFMAEGNIPLTGAVLDLVATTGAVWARDAQVQRVLSGQFASRLWGAYINTLVLSVSGLQELLDAGTISNRQLEATWRSFVLNITPRNAAPIAYTLTGGVGIPRHGTGYGLAAGAAVAPLQGPETYSLPSPVSFNAAEVEAAEINYVPGTSQAVTQAVLNTGTGGNPVYLNAYFGGIMWKNDGTVIPPMNTDCRPADFAAPVRVRAGSMFHISR